MRTACGDRAMARRIPKVSNRKDRTHMASEESVPELPTLHGVSVRVELLFFCIPARGTAVAPPSIDSECVRDFVGHFDCSYKHGMFWVQNTDADCCFAKWKWSGAPRALRYVPRDGDGMADEFCPNESGTTTRRAFARETTAHLFIN